MPIVVVPVVLVVAIPVALIVTAVAAAIVTAVTVVTAVATAHAVAAAAAMGAATRPWFYAYLHQAYAWGVLGVGFGKGMRSNVQVFKVQNGEYRGADEPQKPQNLVRPSK